ncbi:MAG: hypothetical protein GY795_22600 [Desulfobacterales bacterium]|nr:hypothetical protein [Desulfobacterales bacterium]
MLDFKECTLIKLDKMFNLTQTEETRVLQNWLNGEAEISDLEHKILVILQQALKFNVDNWNESELIQHFIGPMFTIVNFSSRKFNVFSERPLSGVVDGIEMGGKPDGMIASGYREPEKPFFCFQEYKKEKNPDGDPAGQTLAAMLVAQEINERQYPVYGCYIRGRVWFFMLSEGREYCISEGYMATRDDIFEIFRILKVLKSIVASLVV